MNEDQTNWNEMIKTIMKINRKLEKMFNIVYIKDHVRNFKTIFK